MTSTVQRYTPPANGSRAPVSQATSIEQSRAIADVQAAVTVAQNCPRDMAEAEAEMVYVCGRLSVAEQAFYRVTNRGEGPSVHLMRELARIWGNIDYGVKELARDDENHQSEVLATCWDMQKNTRSSRTFIVPHARMAQGARRQLDDLTDIYLNNQNIGARAVRECIETVLPKWFTERAQEVCRETLANGEGEPLSERIQKMVAWYREKFGVSQQQLEASVGRDRGKWTADDVAQLKITGRSLVAGEVKRDEMFPPITAEVVEGEPAADPASSKIAGKVKQSRGNRPAEPVANEVPVSADSGDTVNDNPPPAAEQGYDTPDPEPEDEPAPEPPADAETAPAAPGAPTSSTPGQTDRVAAALNKANKGGAAGAYTTMIKTLLSQSDLTEPGDVGLVARHIIGADYKPDAELSLKQIKQVHDTLLAWKDLGTLDQMLTNAINSEDHRNNN